MNYRKWFWLFLTLSILPVLLIYQCGGGEEAQPSETEESTTSSSSSSSTNTTTSSSSSTNSSTDSSSSSTSSSSSSSTSGPCASLDWGSMGKVEVYINVVDPSNAYICSRNGGTATISATSNGAYITYTPAVADLSGTLEWSATYSGGNNCYVTASCSNLITFEVDVPNTVSTISVSSCGLWTVGTSKDTTILRSASNNFAFSDMSDDGNCDVCPCGNCGTTSDYFDYDNAIPVNSSGKAYFIISGFGSCTSFNAWDPDEDAEFVITWQSSI